MIATRPAAPMASLPAALAWLLVLPLAVALALLVSTLPVLAIGVTLAPVAVLAVWRWPGVVFALYLGIPFYKAALPPLPVDLTVALGALCLVGVLPLLRGVSLPGRRALVPWLLFAALVIAGSLHSVAPGALGQAVEAVTLLTGAGLLGLRVAGSADARRHFVLTTLAIGTFALLATLADLGGGAVFRATASSVNPIATARAILLVPLLGLIVAPPRWRPLLVPVAGAAVVTAFATGSRGPLLGLVLTAALLLVGTGHGAGKLRRAGLVAIGGLVLLVGGVPSLLAQWVPAGALDRFTRLDQEVGALLSGGDVTGNTEQSRLAAWSLAMDMTEQCPLAGCGTGSFAVRAELFGLGDLDYPHNLLVQAAAEYGLIGLLLVGAILSLLVRRALGPMPDRAARAIAAMALFLALGALVSDNLVTNRTLWGAVLMVLAMPQAHHFATHAPLSRR